MNISLRGHDPCESRNSLRDAFPRAKSIQLKPGCRNQSHLRNSITLINGNPIFENNKVTSNVRITGYMPELNMKSIRSVKANLSLSEQVVEYDKMGEIRKAMAIIGKIPISRRDPLYEQLAEYYFKNNQVEKANERASKIQHLMTEYKLYKRVCLFYIDKGESRKAVKLLREKLNTKLLKEKIQQARTNHQKNLYERLRRQLAALHRIREKIFDAIAAAHTKQIHCNKTVRCQRRMKHNS